MGTAKVTKRETSSAQEGYANERAVRHRPLIQGRVCRHYIRRLGLALVLADVLLVILL